MTEHLRPNGLSTGYYCARCGDVVNLLATGHGPGFCEPNPGLVRQLEALNRPVPVTRSNNMNDDVPARAATPLTDAEIAEWKALIDGGSLNWGVTNVRRLVATILSLTQQLADLRAKPAEDLYAHGYFSDRSRAGELAPGYGDKEPAPVDDAELVKPLEKDTRTQLAMNSKENTPFTTQELAELIAGCVKYDDGLFVRRLAATLKSRLTQQSAGADAEKLAIELAWLKHRSAGTEQFTLADDARHILERFPQLRAGQPARQPVTREEMFAAFNAAEKLWTQDLRSDKTQWEYYYDAIQALLEGRV